MRVLILGLPGSGKTTFGRKISRALDIPHIEADQLYWNGNQERDLAAFQTEIGELLHQGQWIYEGHYNKVPLDFDSKLTHVIVVPTPLILSLARLIKRELVEMTWMKSPLRSWKKIVFSAKNGSALKIRMDQNILRLRNLNLAVLTVPEFEKLLV